MVGDAAPPSAPRTCPACPAGWSTPSAVVALPWGSRSINEDGEAAEREGSGEIHARCGLADAALLVGHDEDSGERWRRQVRRVARLAVGGVAGGSSSIAGGPNSSSSKRARRGPGGSLDYGLWGSRCRSHRGGGPGSARFRAGANQVFHVEHWASRYADRPQHSCGQPSPGVTRISATGGAIIEPLPDRSATT